MQARAVALDMLLAVTEEKKPSHIVAARELAKYPDMEKKERAFAKRLFSGTLERLLTLDFLLGHYSRTGTDKLKPTVKGILRMGFYQLYYMDVPPSAVCNEAVKLTKKRGFAGLSGFVNGILRNAVRNPISLSDAFAAMPEKKALSLTYSVPEWLAAAFLSWYGRERTEKMFASFLEPAGLTVRVNQSKCGVAQCRERFVQAGVSVQAGNFVPGALHLSGIESVQGLPGFAQGDFTVQDESSMLPVFCAGIAAGDYVIDCCAAPGGKALYAADVLIMREREIETPLYAQGERKRDTSRERERCGENAVSAPENAPVPRRGRVSARDISEYKLAKIRENAERCGFDNVEVMLFDAAECRRQDVLQADVVLADLPCSGLGIIGKKPDIKYNMTPEGLDELAVLQRKILRAAAQYVKPGGVLVYSTCTVNPRENRGNAVWLSESEGLVPEGLGRYLPEALAASVGEDGYLQLLPEAGKWDGFFVARFRKKGGENCK